MLRKRRDERLRERGETLIELIVSTALLGILGLGMITALTSTIMVSNADRGFAGTETVLRSYASTLERRPYKPCLTPGSSANPYTASDLAFSPRPGYTTSITGPRFLKSSSLSTVTAADFQAACPSGATSGDQGAQEFILRATRTDGTAGQSVRVIFRRGDS